MIHPSLPQEILDQTMNAALEQKSYERHSKVGYLISRARAKLNEAIDRELAQFDITAAQYVVLSMLASHSPESAAQLCKEYSYDPGAMTRMIDRLEKKRFLRRVRSPDDRRVIRLELTDQGRTIRPALQNCSIAVATRLLRGFSPSEIEQFESLLERLLANS